MATHTIGDTAVKTTIASGIVELASGGAQVIQGTGSPEGAITAPVGSLFLRTDGGESTLHYEKASGSGNTGWIALYPKSKTELLLAGIGLISQNFDRANSQQALALTAQIMRGGLLPLRAGETVANICFHVDTAPGTPANLTHLKVALFNTAGLQLGVSADTPASGQSTGDKAVALGTPYVVAADGVYIAAVWQDGTSMPSLTAGRSLTGGLNGFGAGVGQAYSQSGLADVPSPSATFAASTSELWLGIS